MVNPNERVIVIAEVPADGVAMARAFSRAGIATVHRGGLPVVAARDPLSAELSRINARMLRRGEPWMLVKAGGKPAWVGPFFIPGSTACWACLAHRLRENNWRESSSRPPGAVLWKRAVEAASAWIENGSTNLDGAILTLGRTGTIHLLTRRPQCPACGNPASLASVPIRLERRLKSDGLHVCTAEETVRRLAKWESELTGIVTPLPQALDGRSFATRTATHCRPLVAGDQGWRARQAIAGKGATAAEAQAACLAEAMERYSIQWQGGERVVHGRLKDFGRNAFSLRQLSLFSDRQLLEAESRNRAFGGFNWIPPVPGDDASLDWSPVWSLTRKRTVYLPTAYCYLYYPSPTYLADSNGCAAGNVIEEAILQGFLELVERDAIGIWWYNRLVRPGIQVIGAAVGRYREIALELAERGRSLAVLDLTTDWEIPVFAAISARRGRGVLIGSAAHLDAEVAMRRALAELCQLVDSLDEVDRATEKPRGPAAGFERALRRWMRNEHIDNHPYLIPSRQRKPLGVFPDRVKKDLRAEVLWCVAQAKRLGLEVLVLDMTRPDIDFPVVRVVVPGMRHCWARMAPGRLYDVPVLLAWRDRALEESELNPISYFL